MATFALSGDDVLILNDRNIVDFSENMITELTFPNKIANVKTGKNGNTVYGYNATGQNAQLKLRLMRGSPDDKWANNLLNQQNLNFAGFPLIQGTFIKNIGDGSGNIISDEYVLTGGVFDEQVGGKSSVEGDIEQSVSIYTLMFSAAPRAIG